MPVCASLTNGQLVTDTTVSAAQCLQSGELEILTADEQAQFAQSGFAYFAPIGLLPPLDTQTAAAIIGGCVVAWCLASGLRQLLRFISERDSKNAND